MRVKVFVLVLFLSIPVWLSARDKAETDSVRTKVYQGFSGGMMLHSGYMFGINPHAPVDAVGLSYSPQGVPMGIGGALRVNLWNHWRVGFEGSVSTLKSELSDQRKHMQPGSYTRIGCGGFNSDACWRLEKVWPYVGAAMGGGAMRSLYMLDGDEHSWEKQTDTYFNKQSFFYVAPYVGFDYCATAKLHLTFRLDWMLAVHKSELVMPTGPRLYFGLMFCH